MQELNLKCFFGNVLSSDVVVIPPRRGEVSGGVCVKLFSVLPSTHYVNFLLGNFLDDMSYEETLG